jgi:hypothetical protein
MFEKTLAIVQVSLITGCTLAPLNTPAARPELLDEAVLVTRDLWSTLFEIELPDPPEVHWLSGQYLELRSYDKLSGRCCIYGVYSNGTIYLAERDTIGDSALAHEMLHWVLDLYGGSDGNHSHPAWGKPLTDIKQSLLEWERMQGE